MKVHADPEPLETPLPDRQAGPSVTVEPMVAGTFTVPHVFRSSPDGNVGAFKLMQASRGERATQPIPSFLIRHPGAGPILVDTGLHASIASDPVENLGRFGNWLYRPALEPGRDVPAQLREKGVDPASIRLVILTHLHVDHASAIADFPDATLIVGANEWRAAATGPRPWAHGYRRQQFDVAFDFRTASFEGDEVSSYASFGRTLDLFGDGSIRLVSTPGDTAGHQSVLVRLKDRDMLIGGDAFYLSSQLEPGADQSGVMADPHRHRRSLQEIRLFHQQFPNAVITPGHDVDFYESVAERFE